MIARYLIVPNATLTIKGLEILSSVPDSIKERTTLGEKVTEAAKRTLDRRRGAVHGREALALLGLRRNAIVIAVATARAWSVTREQ